MCFVMPGTTLTWFDAWMWCQKHVETSHISNHDDESPHHIIDHYWNHEIQPDPASCTAATWRSCLYSGRRTLGRATSQRLGGCVAVPSHWHEDTGCDEVQTMCSFTGWEHPKSGTFTSNKAWNCPLWLQYTAVTAVGVKELSHARWLHSLHWHERMIDRSVWNSNNFNSRSWSHVCPRFFEQAIRDVQSAWKGQNLGSAPTMMLSCRSEESHTIRNHVCFKPQPSSEKRRCQ